MKFLVQLNSTGVLAPVFVQNNSVTTGFGLGSLAYNTSGLTAYYFRQGDSSSTAISLSTMTRGTWASGGLVIVDGTNCLGELQLGVPNACFTTLGSVTVYLQGAANMAPVVLEFQVVAFDPNDAVHLGLSAIPNASSGAANGLMINGANTGTPTFTGGLTTSVSSDSLTAIASTIWQDTSESDFETPSSIGMSLYTSGNMPGAVSGFMINGANTGTPTYTGGLAVNTTQIAGQTASASGTVTFPASISNYTGTDTSGTTTLLNRIAGTLNINNGVIDANLKQILGTLLTETSGYLAAGFKKFFNIATPTLTVGGNDQTGDNFNLLSNGSYGNAALLSSIQNIQNGTFVSSNIPEILERPDSSSITILIIVTFSDETSTAKNLDSGNPTIILVNDSGTDLSSRLGSWSNPATGKYTINYTNTFSDNIEGIHWEITGTVNSKLRRFVKYTQLVDTTAVDFTNTDRTNLGIILGRIDVATSTRAAPGAQMDLINSPNSSAINGIAQQVWNVLTSTLTTTNTIGKRILDFVGSYIYTPSSNSGTGPYNCVWTIKDSNNNNLIQNAIVVFSANGIGTFNNNSDSSGNVTMSLINGTYNVAIYASGYQQLSSINYTVTTDVSTQTHIFILTPTVAPISPSGPGFATGTIKLLDNQGSSKSNVTCYFQLIKGPGTSGQSPDDESFPLVSDGSGNIVFNNFIIGATYTITRGSKTKEFIVSDSESFLIIEIVGHE